MRNDEITRQIIKTQKMGVPTSSAESFELLRQKHVIDTALSEKLKKMVGFRNTVTHQYQRIDLTVVKSVIVSGLNDLIS
jgi:uncharacterized protein YutE (UPF0331/DUF86 family)